MPEKRTLGDMSALVPVAAKKARTEMVVVAGKARQVVEAGPPRSSNMEAPIMLLTGHSGEIYTGKFHPEGNLCASAGFERNIFLWNVYVWDTASRRILYKLPGHLGAVNDVDFHRIEPIVMSVGSDKQIYLGEFEP